MSKHKCQNPDQAASKHQQHHKRNALHISKNDQNERLDGDGADERELSRVETICQTGKVAMLDNLPILVIIIICYQEKIEFHLCQTWKT